MKKTEGTLHPLILAELSIAQKMLLFQTDDPMELALQLANDHRRSKGLAPITRNGNR